MGVKESIGWATKTWNPVTGCWGPGGTEDNPKRCPYCYAHRLAKRLRGRFGYPSDDPFAPTFHPERLLWPSAWKSPKKVFVCSMSDLFAPWIRDELLNTVIRIAMQYRDHTYLFLTKYPERYNGLSSINGNIFFGVTTENQDRATERVPVLLSSPVANPFISIEPMLGPLNLEKIIIFSEGIYVSWLNPLKGKAYHNGPGGVIATDKRKLAWVIVGAQTGPGAKDNAPKQEWIEALIEQVKRHGIPLFMKDNLKPYWKGELIQEWPESC